MIWRVEIRTRGMLDWHKLNPGFIYASAVRSDWRWSADGAPLGVCDWCMLWPTTDESKGRKYSRIANSSSFLNETGGYFCMRPADFQPGSVVHHPAGWGPRAEEVRGYPWHPAAQTASAALASLATADSNNNLHSVICEIRGFLGCFLFRFWPFSQIVFQFFLKNPFKCHSSGITKSRKVIFEVLRVNNLPTSAAKIHACNIWQMCFQAGACFFFCLF